ncbi:hypothetical protein EZH22_10740 [Xanthobacter dioxanivorans]|uniref:Uncharacterized protein n=1 Tax=Xanthobacter dioxanivorans TaxID=2528964 RepID=A0A974SJR1_9HYPH|nr:hypothetical protein [Xanthobacter dioxanivorans]QRG08711.1 hypothetical protein EZH22_10740 [Xanthobacter dioxanivorans]
MSTTDTSSAHVKTLEAIVNAEEKRIAKLLDALPEKTEAALTSAWDKFLSTIDAHLPSGNASEFVDGVKAVVGDLVTRKFDDAQTSLDSLIKTEADHVSAHLGNLIQAMAEFTSTSNGVLSSLLQTAEASGLLSAPAHLAASIGNRHD